MKSITKRPPKCVVENWTQSAKDCYQIGCNCMSCKLYNRLETQCKMKATVLELVRLHGRPCLERVRNEQ